MRATTFFSGLLLTAAVLAAPTPRPQDGGDIEDDNPFMGVDKRAGLDLTANVPSTDMVTDQLKAITEKLPVRDLGLPTDGATKALDPVVQILPIKAVTGAVDTLPVKLPVPVRRRQLDSLLAPVTNLLDTLTGLLSTVLNGLEAASAKVQTLLSNTEGNATQIVSSLVADLGAAAESMQSMLTTLESTGNQGIDEVQALVAKVEATAGQLVTDLQSVDQSLPGVPLLVSTVQALLKSAQTLKV